MVPPDLVSLGSRPSQEEVIVNDEQLAARVAGYGWYHTIDLGDGVVTKGMFDHRPVVDRYMLPADLSGRSYPSRSSGSGR